MLRTICATAALLCPVAALAASQPIPAYTCPTNRYVDAAKGNDTNNGLTLATAWKTIQNADNGWPNTPAAGECININDGTYPLPGTMIFAHGGNLNSPTGYVVYRAIHKGKAHVLAAPGFKSGNGDLAMLWAPYIVVDGLELDGSKALAGGAALDGCANGGQPGNLAHHFVAINNTIHDIGGSGLSSCSVEYVWWDSNDVFRTSSTNLYQTSAINVWKPAVLAPGSFWPTAADNIAAHIVITHNKPHDSMIGASVPGPHTDGNGIIIDTTLGDYHCPSQGTPYPGTILVAYNQAYNNGGGGVHVFLSQNVIVANNTAYNNYLDPLNPGTARGELSNGGSKNITWINDIGFAVPGAGPLAANVPAITYPVSCYANTDTWQAVMTYGAAASIPAGGNFLGMNPMLQDAPAGLFGLMPGSPAIGAGIVEPYLDAHNDKRTFIGAIGVR